MHHRAVDGERRVGERLQRRGIGERIAPRNASRNASPSPSAQLRCRCRASGWRRRARRASASSAVEQFPRAVRRERQRPRRPWRAAPASRASASMAASRDSGIARIRADAAFLVVVEFDERQSPRPPRWPAASPGRGGSPTARCGSPKRSRAMPCGQMSAMRPCRRSAVDRRLPAAATCDCASPRHCANALRIRPHFAPALRPARVAQRAGRQQAARAQRRMHRVGVVARRAARRTPRAAAGCVPVRGRAPAAVRRLRRPRRASARRRPRRWRRNCSAGRHQEAAQRVQRQFGFDFGSAAPAQRPHPSTAPASCARPTSVRPRDASVRDS